MYVFRLHMCASNLKKRKRKNTARGFLLSNPHIDLLDRSIAFEGRLIGSCNRYQFA